MTPDDLARTRMQPHDRQRALEHLREGGVEVQGPPDVAAWIDRKYKPDRLNREPGTRERIIASREHDLREYGSTLISHHDAITGRTEWLHADGTEASA